MGSANRRRMLACAALSVVVTATSVTPAMAKQNDRPVKPPKPPAVSQQIANEAATLAAQLGIEDNGPVSSVLFVQSSGQAHRSKSGKRLEITAPKRTLWFSDRPQRQVGDASTKRFVKLWKSMGFSSDPPNAALVGTTKAGKRVTTIVTISKPRLKHGVLSYRARLTSAKKVKEIARTSDHRLQGHAHNAVRKLPKRLTSVSLFVDDGSLSTSSTAQLASSFLNAYESGGQSAVEQLAGSLAGLGGASAVLAAAQQLIVSAWKTAELDSTDGSSSVTGLQNLLMTAGTLACNVPSLLPTWVAQQDTAGYEVGYWLYASWSEILWLPAYVPADWVSYLTQYYEWSSPYSPPCPGNPGFQNGQAEAQQTL